MTSPDRYDLIIYHIFISQLRWNSIKHCWYKEEAKNPLNHNDFIANFLVLFLVSNIIRLILYLVSYNFYDTILLLPKENLLYAAI